MALLTTILQSNLPQGPSGYSGISGYSGRSGYSGISGYSGTSGYSGEAKTAYISTTPPGSPQHGDMWWDSTTGSLKIYYNDGSSSQWVDAVSVVTGNSGFSGFSGYSGISGFSGYSGVSGYSGISGYSGLGFSGYSGTAPTSTDDTSTNSSYYPMLVTTVGGTTLRTSSTKLYFNPSTGTLNATVFNALSDVTQKTNISSIGNAVELLDNINGIEFHWVDNHKKSAGVLAQEIEKVLPHLVELNHDGLKSVNYSGIIAYLIEYNKELHRRIKNLENKNAR